MFSADVILEPRLRITAIASYFLSIRSLKSFSLSTRICVSAICQRAQHSTKMARKDRTKDKDCVKNLPLETNKQTIPHVISKSIVLLASTPLCSVIPSLTPGYIRLVRPCVCVCVCVYVCCLLYTSPSPRDMYKSRMPSSA